MAYKVTYFDLPGRAEPIRLILSAAGEKYEDIRIKGEEFPTAKPTLPWGQLPTLDVGDKKLAQTVAICRYLGRKHGLVAQDEWDDAKGDEYVDAMIDVFNNWAKYMFEKDEEAKKKLHEEFTSTDLPKYLPKFSAIKEKGEGPYLVGKDKLTWQDIFLADKLESLTKTEGADLLDQYPALKAFKDTVFETPNIKSYVEKRN